MREPCGICLEPSSETCALDCGHSFHALCALKWFRSPRSQGRCPLCRLRPPDDEGSAVSLGVDAGSEWDASSDHDDFETVSPALLHRVFSPWIYGQRRRWDNRLQTLVGCYMACRRRARSGKTEAERARANLRLSNSAELLLAYLVARDLI
jgi:hypothetical protein